MVTVVATTRYRFLLASMVSLVTALVFLPATRNTIVGWDDIIYVEHIRSLTSWADALWFAVTTLSPFYYHPLTWLSHWIEWRWWGDSWAAHHTVSVALHALNAGLVTLLSWELWRIAVGTWTAATRLVAAGIAGLLFGIHPLQVESVAWLAGRKNLLCGGFCIAAVILYLRLAPYGRRRWWGPVTLLHLFALLSKPMAVPLPVVLMLLDFYPLRRQRDQPAWQLGWEKWPLLALSAVSGVLSAIGQLDWGAVMPITTFGLWERLLVAARGLVFGLWKLCWPAWLSPLYPLGGDLRLANPDFAVSVLVLVVLTVAVSVCARHGSGAPAVAMLSYTMFYLPTSGLMQVGAQGAADRFYYVALIGPLLLLVGGATNFVCVRSRPARWVAVALVVVMTASFAVRTRQQIPIWNNAISLWTHVLRFYPNSAPTQFRLARALVDAGRYSEALPLATAAAKEITDDAEVRSLAGSLLRQAGNLDAARVELRAALALDPSLPAARFNLASIEARRGNAAEALRHVRLLLQQHPEFAPLVERDAALAPLLQSALP